MPYLLFEWRAHIQEVLGKFKAASVSVARLRNQVAADASTIADEPWVREHLGRTYENLEGTYIVRMFAAFEAALRSYDRYLFNDPQRETPASVMIDQLGSKRHLSVRAQIRDGVHRARRIRNYWAHDLDAALDPMPIDRVRGFLQSYLDRFPKNWN